MAPLLFQPLASQVTPAFWSALTSLKLDKLKLDDTEQPISGYIESGREVIDREAGSKAAGSGTAGTVGVDGTLGVGGGAFGDTGAERAPQGTIPVSGTFKNFNTIEDFRSTEKKKDLFNKVVDETLQSFNAEEPNLNPFVLVTFADLKKYVYHYWFAFPALVAKPAWEVDEAGLQSLPDDELQEILSGTGDHANTSNGFLVKGKKGSRSFAKISEAGNFFADVPESDRVVVFHDPSSLPQNPGWPLRNILYYLSHKHSISRINIICLRQGSSSRIGSVFLPSAPSSSADEKPSAVGWEKAKNGKLASRVADLGPMMDPAKLADQAVDLNLKLMRWRIMPSLDLDRISSTKCLLLGAGTLGCYVARALMGWGVRNITFVDSAKVSFSNPVRQPLFDFEDCLDGGKPKAQCAADRLKKIFPGINAQAHAFQIPMPGHPIPSSSESSAKEDVAKLESLIASHDAVFLLMDSRESRWLPTVIGASMGKIVMNAALGFDGYLVMRHGGPPSHEAGGRRLGCYYCNDIVAPTDSLTDRTLDQMCTVTRPGVAPIAAASAVELLVSLVQHPLGINAPAETSATIVEEGEGSPLGLVPHQLRGQLGAWKTLLVEGLAYDRCTGCSSHVVDAYRKQGFSLLLRAFNETDFLEELTGLADLHKESEAMMDQLEWDEGSGGEDDF